MEQAQKNNAFFRQLLYLGILVAITVVMFTELKFFLGSFLGAITLYIVLRGTQQKLVNKYGWKPWAASLLLVVITCLVLAGLLFGVFRLIADEIHSINTSGLGEKLNGLIATVNGILPFSVVPKDILSESSGLISGVATGVVNTTYSFVINLLLTILILYFMLAKSGLFEKKLSRYNPFQGESRRIINEDITGIVYSNAVGIPLIMLAQGLTAALVYWLFGMNNIVFWAFLTALAGLIPMIGTIIVSVPLGLAFIMDGEVFKGIMLMLCGLLIIANADNLFRIFLNKRINNTHPLIVIFGVIMGIPMFGFWGIIFGPLLISVFMLLVKIYYLEFQIVAPEDKEEELIAEGPEIHQEEVEENIKKRRQKRNRKPEKKK